VADDPFDIAVHFELSSHLYLAQRKAQCHAFGVRL
jgi:hypothetical protein